MAEQSSQRLINWNKEDRVLRDDMPREFRNLLDELHGKSNNDIHPYVLALQGLGALTYSVAIGLAAAQLRGQDWSDTGASAFLWKALQSSAHVDALRTLAQSGQYMELCTEPLKSLLMSVDHEGLHFTGLLNDVITNRPSTADVSSRLEKFHDGPGHYGYTSHLNTELYDIVSSMFGYWPRHAIGFLQVRGKPRVVFDSDELGELALTDSQLELVRFNYKRLDPHLANLVRNGVLLGERREESINPEKMTTVFLANLQTRKVWMISPFLLYAATGPEREDGKYIFLDPNWSTDQNQLTWQHFNVHAIRGTPQSPRKGMGTADFARVGGKENALPPGAHQTLLQFPFELKFEGEQEHEVFDFLLRQLRGIEFKVSETDVYRVPDMQDEVTKGIFYKTGASLYVEVVKKAAPDSEKLIAKILEPPRHGVYVFEEKRFRLEIDFLDRYFSGRQAEVRDAATNGAAILTDDGRIGAGIVRMRGRGDTVPISGAESDYNGRPFYLREYVDNSLRDIIDEAGREQERLTRLRTEPSLRGRLQQNHVWLARRIMRGLHVMERAAATLALIYDRTWEPIGDALRTSLSNSVLRELGRDEKKGLGVHFVHRDIRPEVLSYPGSGTIKICDFSAAFFPGDKEAEFLGSRVREGTQSTVLLDSYGMSSYYSAPEVYERPNVYSLTADVFSLGMVLNELLFGKKKNVQRRISEWRAEHGAEADWGALLYDEAKDDATFEELRSAVETFADNNRKNAKLMLSGDGPFFDLRSLVGAATCRYDRRILMHEFRNRVALHSQLLRYFIAEAFSDTIGQAIENGGTAHLKNALRLGSSIFGKHTGLRRPSAMVRCADCYDRGEYKHDLAFEQNYTCQSPRMKEISNRLGQVTERIGGTSGDTPDGEYGAERAEISTTEARIALQAMREALQVCPGVMDIIPKELDGIFVPKKVEPHRYFHEMGAPLFQTAGLGDLNVVERGGGTGAPSGSSLASKLLMVFARALR